MARVLLWILTAVYILIILPVGIAMKILRIDRLYPGPRRDAPTYWQSRDDGDYTQEYYEQQL